MHSGRLLFAVTLFPPLLCAQNTGSITGVATNSITGAAIEGVKVSAACVSGGPARCPEVRAVTDAAGLFRLSALPDGRYLITVQREDFSWSYTGLPVATVTAGGETRYDLKLTPRASLHGRVVDPEGKPVAGLTVQSGFGSSATTDEQGNFTLQKLSPGAYLLSAKVKPQADGKDGERLVTTYFPSAIDAEQAVRIQVDGVDVSGYEIRLRTAPARTVRGVVLDADGKPRPHASVTLSKAVPPEIIPMILGAFSPLRTLAAQTVEGSDTGADGKFEFPAVLEGDWILKSYDIGNRQSASVEMHVGRSDVDDITVRLAKPFPIEVSTDLGASAGDTGSQSSVPPRASAWIVPLDGQVAGGIGTGGTDAGPPFTQHGGGPAGRYLFGPAEATAGYYVAAAMLDGRDVKWQAVELSGPTEVKLILKTDGGTLRGVVEKGGGSTVVLMADPTAYARFGLTAHCDPDGNFSISDIPPGDYTAVAFKDNFALYSPGLLTRIDAASRESVKIEAGASATVTLRVN